MASSIADDLLKADIYSKNLQDVISLTQKLLDSANHSLAIKLDIEKASSDSKALENLLKEEEKAQEELLKAYRELHSRNDIVSMVRNVSRNRSLLMSIPADKVMSLDERNQEDRDFVRRNERRVQQYKSLVRERNRRIQRLNQEVDIALLEVRHANERAQIMRVQR